MENLLVWRFPQNVESYRARKSDQSNPSSPDDPVPALCYHCVSRASPSVFLPLSPFSSSFLASLPTSCRDEVASEEPSLIAISTVTHGNTPSITASAAAANGVSRCKLWALLLCPAPLLSPRRSRGGQIGENRGWLRRKGGEREQEPKGEEINEEQRRGEEKKGEEGKEGAGRGRVKGGETWTYDDDDGVNPS